MSFKPSTKPLAESPQAPLHTSVKENVMVPENIAQTPLKPTTVIQTLQAQANKDNNSSPFIQDFKTFGKAPIQQTPQQASADPRAIFGITPSKPIPDSLPKLSIADRMRQEESPFQKFVSSTKKAVEKVSSAFQNFGSNVGNYLGIWGQTPNKNPVFEAERAEKMNSSKFKLQSARSDERFERLSKNPDFIELISVPFAERLEKQSAKIREVNLKSQENLNKMLAEKLPGESIFDVASRRISQAYENEDLHSGFKPKRSNGSEGEAFYAQLWKQDSAPLSNFKPAPSNSNLADFFSQSQQKFYDQMGKQQPSSDHNLINNWFKKTTGETTNKGPSIISTKDNTSNSFNHSVEVLNSIPHPNHESNQPGIEYEISDVSNSSQDFDLNEEWRDEDDLDFQRSVSNSNTRLAIKDQYTKIRELHPSDPPNDWRLFNKRSGLNLSQSEFADLVKLNTPVKPKTGRKVLFIGNKRIPEWALDLKAVGKETIAQNTFGRYKAVFGKVKPIKMLDPEKFFPKHLLKNYKR